ncbi:GntR family transcriptional regulator [Caldanaerobius fijiensis DSM 17918]|uniref:GntR family transcriptional regulator n=1 Tax=Caldanaerobius fijiensis DSM 17918 TaxID=1121256 RepID=A0A1M5B5Y7_9THEO|nr:GntR family transcriptional regulator [Caldanaerobius fijiensis]SHF37592.1 GntR family transcriptional regulator [Caldanaerobius fijiensis DSM 17918]
MERLDEKSPIALYIQLRNILIDKIKSGQWKVNDKIPTERELCDMYNVSRATVRLALQELERDGYIYRKQGRGTFVAPPKIEQNITHFYSFSEEMKKRGLVPSSKILGFEVIKSDKKLADILNLKEGDEVLSLKRLRLANGEPIMLETSYLPYNMCRDMTREDVEKMSLYEALRTKCGIIPNSADETFEPVLTNSYEAEVLNYEAGKPALLLERITYSFGTPIEYNKGIVRGDRCKYRVSLK